MAARMSARIPGNREIFLTPFALAVAAQIKAQRCDVGSGQPGCQPSEEATLLARDAPTMHQGSRLTSTLRQDEGAGQGEAIGGVDVHDGRLRRHVSPSVCACHPSLSYPPIAFRH